METGRAQSTAALLRSKFQLAQPCRLPFGSWQCPQFSLRAPESKRSHGCSEDPARIAHGMNFFWRRAHLLDPKAGQALQCWLWGDLEACLCFCHLTLVAATYGTFHLYRHGDRAMLADSERLPSPCALKKPKLWFGCPSPGFHDVSRPDNMPTPCKAIELQIEKLFHP